MYNNKKIGVIIAAAGSGSRMEMDIPKQFLIIDDKPVVVKAFQAFADCPLIDFIYVVTNEKYMEECREIMVPYLNHEQLLKFSGIISGGKERQDSIYRAMQAISRQGFGIDYILVHDGARPFVSEDIIVETVEAAVKYNAAVVCVKPKDTIRTKNETLDRDSLYAVQTPQGFGFNLLMNAHQKAFDEGFYGTDDASLVERLGVTPKFVDGSYENIKITTKEDMPTEIRVGSGYDVHRLVEGRKCIIGGVDIPNETGLLGHSDADVLTHAIMDALLGAAGLGDIGKHFPDTDDKYEMINSLKLLNEVGKILAQNGYTIGNIDATVICEKPKISPYIKEMIENISKTLKIDNGKINIKGTTTEKLGFTGRKEGIAAEAVCIIKRN